LFFIVAAQNLSWGRGKLWIVSLASQDMNFAQLTRFLHKPGFFKHLGGYPDPLPEKLGFLTQLSTMDLENY
jgi:hypothetical protein